MKGLAWLLTASQHPLAQAGSFWYRIPLPLLLLFGGVLLAAVCVRLLRFGETVQDKKSAKTIDRKK